MATCNTERFIGQGIVYVAPRASGGAISGAWKALGDTESLQVSISQDFVDDYESCSGNRTIAAHIPIQTDWNFSVDAKSFSKENLARAFYGSSAAVVGSTVTDEAVVAYEAGAPVPLKFPGVSAVTVESATSAGVTLTVTDDYTVDAANGTITLTSAGYGKLTEVSGAGKKAYVSYTYSAHEEVQAGTETIAEYAFRFEGINLATKKSVIVNIHRVALNMTEALSLIGVEVNRFRMSGMVLPDSTQPAGDSQYMTIIKL